MKDTYNGLTNRLVSGAVMLTDEIVILSDEDDDDHTMEIVSEVHKTTDAAPSQIDKDVEMSTSSDCFTKCPTADTILFGQTSTAQTVSFFFLFSHQNFVF